MARPRYISKQELKDIIKSDKKSPKDFLVIDVRDDDYEGGNITNSRNFPSEAFDETVKELAVEAKDVPSVIFHCALSQQRGPKTARIYAETRAALAEKEGLPVQEVMILRGGFTEWQALYKDDPELVEKWDKSVWGGRTYWPSD